MHQASDDRPAWRRVVAGPVHRFDDAVDRAADRLRGEPRLDRLMYTLSELGDWSLLWHLLAWGGAWRAGRHDVRAAAAVSACLGVESALVNGGVKRLLPRNRPVWTSETARPHRLRTPRTTSFPSGHASAAMVAATLLAARQPRWRLAYYLLAGLVGASRVHVRIHHASDVAAGWGLGALIGVAARRACAQAVRPR
ncbi:MAG: phosphatase PAP2 family protein [Acidimicrobiales bacterium]